MSLPMDSMHVPCVRLVHGWPRHDRVLLSSAHPNNRPEAGNFHEPRGKIKGVLAGRWRAAESPALLCNSMFSAYMLALAAILVLDFDAVLAAPWPAASKLGTHRVQHLRRGIKIEAYHPASTYEVRHGSFHRLKNGLVAQSRRHSAPTAWATPWSVAQTMLSLRQPVYSSRLA